MAPATETAPRTLVAFRAPQITGALVAGKLKGTVTRDQQKTSCVPYAYSAKFYGVNPQG